jgi:hypothetical protein
MSGTQVLKIFFRITQEGHIGMGVDLTARKLWNSFSPTADLRIADVLRFTQSSSEVTPLQRVGEVNVEFAKEGKFDGPVDWVISNHADELTPYAPIMASALSPHTRHVFSDIHSCELTFFSSSSLNRVRKWI